jgi:hypothetical protein
VSRPPTLLMLLALTGLSGCEAEDVGRLTRVCGKAVDNFRASTGRARDELAGRLPSLQGDPGATLAGRVTARLRWDAALADADIEVSEEEAVVRLSGEVADPAARRRAVDLARTTDGVDEVIDDLSVPDKDE